VVIGFSYTRNIDILLVPVIIHSKEFDMSRLDLQLEKTIYHLGETVRGVLVSEMDRPVKARGIRLVWQGVEKTHITVQQGKHSYTYREQKLWASQAIGFRGSERFEAQGDRAEGELKRQMGALEAVELAAGTQRYDFAFEIPAEAPPSYTGKNALVTYTLMASVDIPRRPDVRQECAVQVLAAPRTPSQTPAATVSYPPVEGQPGFTKDVLKRLRPEIQMNLRLDQAEVQPGGGLEGRVSFTNSSNRQVKRVVLELTQVEYARAGKHERTTTNSTHTTTELVVGESGDLPIPTPFQMPVPVEFQPDWEGAYSRVFHIVQARLDVAWALDIKVEAPVRIVEGVGS
jgi:hypothetical protein